MKKLFCIILGILVVTGLIVLLFNLDMAVEFANNFVQNERIVEGIEDEKEEVLEDEEELVEQQEEINEEENINEEIEEAQ